SDLQRHIRAFVLPEAGEFSRDSVGSRNNAAHVVRAVRIADGLPEDAAALMRDDDCYTGQCRSRLVEDAALHGRELTLLRQCSCREHREEREEPRRTTEASVHRTPS